MRRPADPRLLRRTFMQLGVLLAGCSEVTAPPATPTTTTGGAGSPPGGTGGAGGSPPNGFPDLSALGPLLPPDVNGLRLPEGLSARIVARSGEPVAPSSHIWHGAPDGGATFATSDGGWIYVSNSELGPNQGGAGALRFDADANLVDAYPLLTGTTANCAGGPTPWGTWLSCEEWDGGRVWECFPAGATPAIVRPALGVFAHEAVAVDPDSGILYLTEDTPDGRLYRFVPTTAGDLSAGTLEVAVVTDQVVGWAPIPDPSAQSTPTRHQVASATIFPGGEGIWFFGGTVFFTTKGNDRVWALEVSSGALSVIYDAATAPDPVLTGVDNVTVSPAGDVLVAEDGGDMQIVVLPPGGGPRPLLQVLGQEASEITGPAFDPSYRRLYFSSQRGTLGTSSAGITYEVTVTA